MRTDEPPGFAFRPLTAADLPLVRRWLHTPAVRAWWVDASGATTDIDEDMLADPRIAHWLVSHAGRPFAFIQDYDPHAWPGHPFGFLPPGSRGLDQFIGEPDMLGQGHGHRFIRAHGDALFAHGAPALGVDPDRNNARAIRAFMKAGFVAMGEHDAGWTRQVLMVRWAG